MNKSIGLVAISAAFAVCAFANDQESGSSSGMQSAAVEKLKSALPSRAGFEVLDERSGQDGVSCITYRVSNSHGASNKAHAVVDGDTVLHESTGNTKFAKEWNSKCATGNR